MTRPISNTTSELIVNVVGIKQELDRTKKQLVTKCNQLEIAVDVMKYTNKCIKGGCVNWETEIDKALEQITALEQKGVK